MFLLNFAPGAGKSDSGRKPSTGKPTGLGGDGREVSQVAATAAAAAAGPDDA